MHPTINRWLAAVLVLTGLPGLPGKEIMRRISQHIVINKEGHALVHYTEDMSQDRPLSEIHDRHTLLADKRKSVAGDHRAELSRGFEALFGVAAEFAALKPAGEKSAFRATGEGRLKNLARPLAGRKEVRIIAAKPFNAEKQPQQLHRYFEFMLDELVFQSIHVASREDADSMVTRYETTFELPKEARILNADELRRHNRWTADFGGGSRLESELKVEGSRVTVVRHTVVTRGKPEHLLSEGEAARKIRAELDRFERYAIHYTFPGAENMPTAAVEANEAELDFSREWSKQWKRSQTREFKHQNLTASAGAELSLELKAAMSWEWDWTVAHGFRLQQFNASIDATPRLDLSAKAEASAQVAWASPRAEIHQYSEPFVFFVGSMPVEVTLEATLGALATASADGKINLSTGALLECTTGIACSATSGAGWNVQPRSGFNATFRGFTADANLSATVRGDLPLEITALIYHTAGPRIELTPYLQAEATAQATTVSPGVSPVPALGGRLHYVVKGGLDLKGGIKLGGWLKDLLEVPGTHDVTAHNIERVLHKGEKQF